eukprot:augustus_masked-scaffold_43-processed-gene-1.3-mRNA-1 protein AED:1.00 eAED:1.00 QI:0/-1/0/0/-1/1/1/0/398
MCILGIISGKRKEQFIRSMSSGTPPRTWLSLRFLGLAIRNMESGNLNATYKRDPEYLAALDFLHPYFKKVGENVRRENFTHLKEILEKPIQDLGPPGVLALSDVDSLQSFTSTTDLIVMYVHCIFLQYSKHGFRFTCTGAGDPNNNTFNSDISYPEIFPQGWKDQDTYYLSYNLENSTTYQSVRIELVASENSSSEVPFELESAQLKKKITLNISKLDLITDEDISERLAEIWSSLEESNQGPSSILSRGAARTLQTDISTRLIDPLIVELRTTVENRVSTAAAPTLTVPVPAPAVPLLPQGPPRYEQPRFPAINPGGYGDGDLFIGRGGGGNLLGPGHPAFRDPNASRNPDLLGGPRVPGARFDPPMGPPRPSGRRNRDRFNPDGPPNFGGPGTFFG